MGFFDFLKSDDPEPQLTVESQTTETETETERGRGRGGGVDDNLLEEELANRQQDYDDYRERMLSGEFGNEMGRGQGQEYIDELNRLGNLIKETQDKINARDERNLGMGAGMGALSGLAANTAGELMSEHEIGGEGQLGGNQQRTQRDLDLQQQLEDRQRDYDEYRDRMQSGEFGDEFGGGQGQEQLDELNRLADLIQETQDEINAPPPPPPPAEFTLSAGNLGDEGVYAHPIPARPGFLGDIDRFFGAESQEDIDAGRVPGTQEYENIQSGEPSAPPQLQEQQQYANIHPDANVDIEASEMTFSQTSDPFIESGKENPPDVSIFRSMIHVATKMSYDFLKQSSGLDKAEYLVPDELRDVVSTAIFTLETTNSDDIGSSKASSKKRMKFNIVDKKHDMIHNPILYPFFVIALNFYMAKNEGDLMQFNWIMKQGISYVMKNYLKLPSVNVDYFLNIYGSFPQSLNNAFIRNSKQINLINPQEKREIKSFIKTIIDDYNSKFSPNKFFTDIQKYEHGGYGLLSILKNLGNPKFLFEINKSFETIDNFITNIKNNKDVLIGLMGLIYAEARNEGKLLNEAIISNGMIDGIVYYKKKINRQQKRDLDVELMIQMENEPSRRKLEGFDIKYNDDKLAEFENKEGDTTILFRGTNFKEKDFLKKDFTQNILNFAGSKEIFISPEYNKRYEKATELILEKQREISNSGKGSLKVQGYSLGGIGAMYISILFPDIPVKVYNPVISDTQLTREMVQELVNRNSNIEFFAVEEDPISNNLAKFKDKLKITYIKKNKFFSSHSLRNYLF